MTARFIIGDVFDVLATLEDGSVDLVVTSPPFLALRSYLPADHPDKEKEIGSEATPAAFIDVMLAVTKELRRVLAPHGSICVELGDTYSAGEVGVTGPAGGYDNKRPGQPHAETRTNGGRGDGWPMSKSKTLIPELYRIGLAYGINPLTGQESPAGKWRVRNVVTWARPNPPVGALGDKWRPATSDVVIACLSGKRYWDDLATRRPHLETTLARAKYGWTAVDTGGSRNDDGTTRQGPGNHLSGAPLLDYWEIPLDGGEGKAYGPKEKPPRDYSKEAETTAKRLDKRHRMQEENGLSSHPSPSTALPNEAGAPLLDYWEIPPTGYSGSHYAVFPPALVVPLVQAMAPPKVCRVCGEPSRRIVDVDYTEGAVRGFTSDNGSGRGGHQGIPDAARINSTLGWTDCGHDSWRPALVLDPFAGSGTTLLVATGYGHDAIGIDLDARNAELALERVGPFLLEVAQ